MALARRLGVAVALVGLLAAPVLGGDGDGGAFFEAKVRPVLVEQCHGCHSAKAPKLKGGLRLDGRAALLAGGDGGPAVVPGDPARSRLIEAIHYQNVDLRMPPKGKLPEAA